MKVSDLIANLLSQYTNCVFGGQGGSVVHLVDSIHNHKRLKFIPGQNEQASSIAADAYYRSSGNLGVAIGTSGPGILNLLQGMACSYFDSIPSLYISGAPVVSQIRKNKNIRQIGFQEMEVVDLVKPITKYAVLIKDKKEIEKEFIKAINIAFDGRMGPVLIDLPDDLSREHVMPIKKNYFIKKKIINKKQNILESKVLKIKKLLENSKRPLLLIGNGIKLSKSQNLIKKFIKKYKIPYACSWATVDDFQSDDNLNAGTFGVAATRFGNFALQNSDLLLCLGLRLSAQIMGSNKNTFSPNSKKVLIEIDKNELLSHRLPKIEVKVNSDVKNFLIEFSSKKMNFKKNQFDLWKKKILILKNKYPIVEAKHYKNSGYVDPYAFFNELSKNIKKGTILIPDASANLMWCMQAFQKLKDTKIFTALNHSPMGYSVAASVGAFFGNPKKNIISIIGDGSMPMNIQELETIFNYNVNVKIFVINNNGYGLIKQTQETWLNSRYSGVDKKSGLSLPDNKKLSNAYGVKAISIKDNKEMKNKLKNILNIKGPMLVDLNINPKTRVAPKIEYGNPLHDMSPKIPRHVLKEILNN
jgi:acetolactate synthase I/II/III large subunit